MRRRQKWVNIDRYTPEQNAALRRMCDLDPLNIDKDAPISDETREKVAAYRKRAMRAYSEQQMAQRAMRLLILMELFPADYERFGLLQHQHLLDDVEGWTESFAVSDLERVFSTDCSMVDCERELSGYS